MTLHELIRIRYEYYLTRGGGVVIANNNYTEMKYGDKVLMDSFSV